MRSTIMTPIVFTVPACAVDVVLEFDIVRLPFLDVHDDSDWIVKAATRSSGAIKFSDSSWVEVGSSTAANS